MKHMVTCTGHRLEKKGFKYGEMYEVVDEGDSKEFTVQSDIGEYILSKKLFKEVGTQETMALVQDEISNVFDEANTIIQGLLVDLTELKILDDEETAK